MVMDLISGQLMTDAADLYERLKNMKVSDWVDLLGEMGTGAQKWLSDIWTKLTTGDVFDRGFYLGEIVGYIIAEIILTIITDGILAAVKWGPKVLKYLGKFGDWIIDRIKNIKGIKKTKAGNLTPDAKDLTPDAKKLDGPGHTKENNLNLEKQIDAGKSTKAKELESKVDGAEKQKLENDAETEVDKQVAKDNPDHDNKVKALATAKVITEGADIANLPIDVLMTELSFLKKVQGVTDFLSKWLSNGIYDVFMIGSKLTIKEEFNNNKGFPSIFDETLEKIKNGLGVPRIDPATGKQTIFEARKLVGKQKYKWEGALEWDIPGTKHRILEKVWPDGKSTYGRVVNHNYDVIYEFK